MQYEKKTFEIVVGDIIADASGLTEALWKVPHAIKITSVRFGANATIAAQDTDYQKIAVKNGSNEIASITLGPAAGGDTLTLGTFVEKTPAAAYAECAAADTLTIAYTLTGAGLAVTGLVIQIEYYDINA